MAKNRGKDFENLIRSTLNTYSGLLCERLHDQLTGYVNVSRNPSDFIVYKYPNMYFLECKTIHGASVPMTAFRQLPMLEERCVVPGVYGIFLIWFVDHEVTYWVDFNVITTAQRAGLKSLNYETLKHIDGVREVPAIYKRVYGKYDFSEFFGGVICPN